jgi:hypothetical protein
MQSGAAADDSAAAAAAVAACVSAADGGDAGSQSPSSAASALDTRSVEAALAALYSPASAREARRAADTYLQSWQASPSAWAGSLALLAGDAYASSAAYQKAVFGAATVHRKVTESWRALPPDAAAPLRAALLAHMARLSGGPAAAAAAAAGGAVAPAPAPPAAAGAGAPSEALVRRSVVQRLCLAYAAAAVQGDEGAEAVVGGLAARFPPSAPRALPVLLAALGALPQEAVSERLRGRTQRRQAEFMTGLTHVAPQVLPLLTTALQAAGERSDAALAGGEARAPAAALPRRRRARARVAARRRGTTTAPRHSLAWPWPLPSSPFPPPLRLARPQSA